MMNRKGTGRRKSMEPGTIAGKSDAKLSRDIQAKIGQQLRAMYDDVLNQGVPSRFTDILSRLDRADNGDPDRADNGDKDS